jgi:hypothetical protein
MKAMESKPQGEQTGEWVKEVGKSECHAVMVWIRTLTLSGTKVSRLPTGVGSREISGQHNLYGVDRR